MPAPDKVKALIDNFGRHIEDYRRGRKGETEIRVEFIDPFFEALGWDVNNTSGYAEAYKDVVHEDAIKVGGTTKAPDYCFRVGGTRKFFLEAKKPSVDIATDIAPAYQLRRYAWSAKLPLSILTDFEEFAVYDCRVRPAKGDKASKARVQYLTYTDYIDHWDELAATFSKEAILQGSFDKYVHDKKKAKGTAEVDDEFLREIERWRDALARNIALRNPGLGVRDVNFAVQRTIDRIIFLRMCEDRGVEEYARLQGLINGEGVYPRLLELFRAADDRYNSGLFHFNDERDRATSPDTLTPDLDIDDKVLKDIFKNLYYPDSPYEFGVLPADILGNVYEQFLGKVIRLTPSGQAKVEEKPEVKKAGGVYYTPKYIVDYIVKHTLGELIDGKTPIEIGGLTDSYKPSTARNRRPITVCDPACGSGSFLIGAYRYLLTYHRDWYVNDGPENHAERIYQGAGGQWYLTTEEKKRILLSCIYGVDIDPQAVEVTKLNLLLAVLENENQQTLGQLSLIHQRVLPDLGNNIKCGNSLIASDFYQGQQLDLFDEDAQWKINAFDWPDEFPHILGRDLPENQRGFNAVIGNPPYVYRNAIEDTGREYYRDNYHAAEGNFELYKFFLERGTHLICEHGRLGMIVSASFLIQATFTKLRQHLLTATRLERVCPLGPGVFSKATVDTAIMIGTRTQPADNAKIVIVAPQAPEMLDTTEPYLIEQQRFFNNEGHVFDYRLDTNGASLVSKLFEKCDTLETEFEFGVGINTGFIKSELTSERRNDERYHRMVPGSGISRYGKVKTKGWILYDPEFVKKQGKRGRSLPPERFFDADKILVVRTRNLSLTRRVVATLDREKNYNLNRLSNIITRGEYSIEGLLGLLNSRLFNWLFSTRFYDYEIKPIYLRQCPLPPRSPDVLSSTVNRMLDLHKQLGEVKNEHGRVMLERQITATDREIDALVYELYGLTDEEIAIVEAATG